MRSNTLPSTRGTSRVVPALPSKSPCLTIAESEPRVALSIASAEADSSRAWNTPTTAHALFSFSGLPVFMLNSI